MDEQTKKQIKTELLEQIQRLINQRLDDQKSKINHRFDHTDHRENINRKTNLKQGWIIDAALELLSNDGLDNLSLRDIAKRLHIHAPAIYWYFKSKEVLIDYMAETILNKEFNYLSPRVQDETWQSWLTNHMVRLRRAMLAYPDGGRVVAGAHFYPTVTLPKLIDCALESLITAGIDIHSALHIVMTTTHYTFGFVIEEQAAPTKGEEEINNVKEFLEPYPNLAKAMNEKTFSPGENEDDFIIGLKYIINGSGK